MTIASVAQAADVENLHITRETEYTRVVFDTTDRAQYSVFVLEDPYRVVIDIRNSQMRINPASVSLPDSPVRSVRSGVRNDTDTRVVLDVTGPVNPASFTLLPGEGEGHRLIVDLYDIGREPPVVQAPVTAPESLVPAADNNAQRRNIVVAIDAGHGGSDPGAIGYDGRIREKDVALAISRAVYDRLKVTPGYEPVMTRQGDYFIRIQQRPQLARENRADIFLSIHADSYSTARAEGVTVYALSQTTAEDENIRRVSEKENAADLLGGVAGDTSLRHFDDDLALTLLDLSMAWSIEQSMMAGSHILNAMGRVATLRRDKPQQGNLWVLRSPDIPSLLIETGYLSNPTEARRLASPDYQKRLADSIVQGVMSYFYERPPEGSLIAWQKANNQRPGMEYVVGRGDSLSMIAQRHNVTMAELRAANNLSGDTIRIGQRLTIPGSGAALAVAAPVPVRATEHTIARGETLSGIAQRYQVSLSSLRSANNLRNDTIRVGQVLIIPAS